MLRIAQLTLDVQDIEKMAAFWSAALGYRVERGDDGNAKLLPPDDAPLGTQHMWLQASAGPKDGKNRAHPDLTADDPDAEVERLLGLGARHADVGQRGDEPYVVLADPEGNEFCVLTKWRDPALGA
jgi:catechol 2,3-dioxygenase-like lactoylglutathione lyase family enzyme